MSRRARGQLPADFPCRGCCRAESGTCGQACGRLWIYYADFMHRCRVICGRETPERQTEYEQFVRRQRMMSRLDDNNNTED